MMTARNGERKKKGKNLNRCNLLLLEQMIAFQILFYYYKRKKYVFFEEHMTMHTYTSSWNSFTIDFDQAYAIPSYCCCHGISNFSSFLYSPYLLNYNKSLHMIRSLSPLVLIVKEREKD